MAFLCIDNKKRNNSLSWWDKNEWVTIIPVWVEQIVIQLNKDDTSEDKELIRLIEEEIAEILNK